MRKWDRWSIHLRRNSWLCPSKNVSL